MVVHGHDGMDELTVFDQNHVAELHDGKVTRVRDRPGRVRARAHRPLAASPAAAPPENAARVRGDPRGQKGAGRDIVVLNAAAALVVAGVVRRPRRRHRARAAAAIDSGEATRKLADLAAFRG